MIRRILRAFCASSLLLATACASTGPKLYLSRPAKGGIVRAQEQEFVPYSETDGWYVVTPEDLELIVLEAKERLGQEEDKK